MDIMTHRRVSKDQKKNSKGKKKSSKNNFLKVVYISSPMKVKTSASRFRSLVQELTGKNSDISQYMEARNNNYDVGGDHFYEISDSQSDDHHNQVFSSISSEDTPTSSDSFLGPIDDVFISQIDEQFGGFFSSNSSSLLCEMDDVLGSYDELL